MSAAPQLWRMETVDVDASRLDAALRLHIAYAPLTTIAMRAGGQLRRYIGTPGCDGCAAERCAPGCHGELLRRALRGACAELSLTPIVGLAQSSYAHAALLWPLDGAEPMTFDAGGAAARLTLRYTAGPRRTVRCAGLLRCDDIALIAALRAQGWRSMPLPGRLAARLGLVGGTAWRGAVAVRGGDEGMTGR